MKKIFAIFALATLIGVQAFAQVANAASAGCTYDGYPCSQWNQMQDGW